jgi:hypothetical protein
MILCALNIMKIGADFVSCFFYSFNWLSTVFFLLAIQRPLNIVKLASLLVLGT